MCIVVMLVILLSSSYLALVQALRRDVLIFVIQLFQLRLSPEQSGKVEYERERLLGIMNLLAIPSSLSRLYSTFPLCSGDNLN
jgi:hypothetical protein